MSQHESFDPRPEPRFWFTLDVAIARESARPLTGERPVTFCHNFCDGSSAAR